MCQFLFNHSPISSTKVLLAISTSALVFLDATGHSSPSPLVLSMVENLMVFWSPSLIPFFFFFKINVDAHWSSSVRNGFVGIVIRGAMGQFVVAAQFAVQAPNASTAEALAMLRGCQLAANLGYR